jgi:hypothetical protein
MGLLVNILIDVCNRYDRNILQLNYHAGGHVVTVLARIATEAELKAAVDVSNGPPMLECNICTCQFEPKGPNECPSCGSSDVKIAFVPKTSES